MKKLKLARLGAVAGVALLLFGSTGCIGGGLLYTRVTVPLDVNLDRTPVYQESASDSWKTLRIYYLQFDWGSDAIGEVAKRKGMTRVHYADLETLRILGVWTERTVHVYGER